MAVFSYQLHQLNDFLLDSSVVLPSFPIDISEFLEEFNNSASQNCCSQYSNNSKQLPVNVNIVKENNEPDSVTKKNSSNILEMESSPVITDRIEISRESITPMERKKNTREGSSSMSSCQFENVRVANHGKKQRTSNGQLTNEAKEKKSTRGYKIEAPTGYIFVRARRGQATDSHSLTERVRREKISERMKILQSLVPGCDQVTGKAQKLDEIINYVQSLQNKIEFLSMKLASLGTMYYDFGVDLDALNVRNDQVMVQQKLVYIPLSPKQHIW